MGPPESQPGPSGFGSVVADVGQDVGALVVYLPASTLGREVEIRPLGKPWDGTHTAIRQRHLYKRNTVAAGFFGSLCAGRYELRLRDGPSSIIQVDVLGAEITEMSWNFGADVEDDQQVRSFWRES